MNFQHLQKVETVDFYQDLAFGRSSRRADQLRTEIRGSKKEKAQRIEGARMDVVASEIEQAFDRIIKSFPSFDNLHIFYQELVTLWFDPEKIKKALGALAWVTSNTKKMLRAKQRQLRDVQTPFEANEIRRSFFGRVGSLLKQIKDDLAFLEDVRQQMKSFPTIKTETLTFAIAGFPNVGKSTLLTKITTSTPEINSYAFTTRKLNVGYCKEGRKKVQLIDTPGTLNRFEKMNAIEKQAHLAMHYVSHAIIYVFDLTQEAATLEDQFALFEKIEELGKDMFIYLSKTDILDTKIVEDFTKKHSEKYQIFSDKEELKKVVLDYDL